MTERSQRGRSKRKRSSNLIPFAGGRSAARTADQLLERPTDKATDDLSRAARTSTFDIRHTSNPTAVFAVPKGSHHDAGEPLYLADVPNVGWCWQWSDGKIIAPAYLPEHAVIEVEAMFARTRDAR